VIRISDGQILSSFPAEITTPTGDRASMLSLRPLDWTERTAFGVFETGPLSNGNTGTFVAALLLKNDVPIGFGSPKRIGPPGAVQAKFGTSTNGFLPVIIARSVDSSDYWIGYCSVKNKTPDQCHQDTRLPRYQYPEAPIGSLITR
jgi:hypothetical protein